MQRIRNKRTRILTARHKLLKLYNETKNKYGIGVYYNRHKRRLIKISINNSKIRCYFNRRFRHHLNSYRYKKVQDGGAYRKHEEYCYAIY